MTNKTEKIPEIRRKHSGLTQAILALKAGQALRITSASEARNLGGISGIIQRKSGKKLRSQADGDDVLVWLENA